MRCNSNTTNLLEDLSRIFNPPNNQKFIHGRESDSPNADGILSLPYGPGEGLCMLPDVTFTTGVISCQIRGEDKPRGSFVGVAFGLADAERYEVVWLRPFNFRSTEPERYRHAIQYASMPDHNWHHLRQSDPDVYEAALRSDEDPNDWVDLRLDISDTTVAIRVGCMRAPCLTVKRINPQRGDGIGLWVGNTSAGNWRNLELLHSE